MLPLSVSRENLNAAALQQQSQQKQRTFVLVLISVLVSFACGALTHQFYENSYVASAHLLSRRAPMVPPLAVASATGTTIGMAGAGTAGHAAGGAAGMTVQVARSTLVIHEDTDPDPTKVPEAPVQLRLVTATRFWGVVASDLERLAAWLARAVQYSDLVIVTLRSELDRQNTPQFIQTLGYGDKVRVVLIDPWMVVSAALNVMVVHAAHVNAEYLLITSIEVTSQTHHIAMLLDEMHNDTFVAGGALPHSHKFVEGKHDLDGLNTPWNTFAVWDVKTLVKVGFGTLADRPPGWDFKRGGLEEIPTIALLQLMARASLHDPTMPAPRTEAKLLLMPDDLNWEVDFSSPLRRDRHVRKMNSKIPQGQELMRVMDIPAGTVQHVLHPSLRHTEAAARQPVRSG